MTLAAYAEERLFGPLRMSNTQFFGQYQKLHDRAAGYVERGSRYRKIPQPMLISGAGGLFTTIDDLLHWDDNFSNPVLGGAAFLNFMFARGRLRGGEPLPYAAGLILGRYSGLEVVSHPGSLPGYRSEMIRFPAQRLTVACLCNRADEESPLLARPSPTFIWKTSCTPCAAPPISITLRPLSPNWTACGSLPKAGSPVPGAPQTAFHRTARRRIQALSAQPAPSFSPTPAPTAWCSPSSRAT